MEITIFRGKELEMTNMRLISSLVAVASLFMAIAFVPVIGAALIVLLLFGVFLLALVGVFSGLEDRTVRQHDPVLDGRRWREGS
jgi:hypothetical protein